MIPTDAATLAYRVSELEEDVKLLQRKVDRLMWALVTLSMSLIGSAIVFALAVTSTQR